MPTENDDEHHCNACTDNIARTVHPEWLHTEQQVTNGATPMAVTKPTIGAKEVEILF